MDSVHFGVRCALGVSEEVSYSSFEHWGVFHELVVSVALEVMVLRLGALSVPSSLSSPYTNACCGPNTLATLAVTWLNEGLRIWDNRIEQGSIHLSCRVGERICALYVC